MFFSKITQVFRRTVFPTHFATHRQCLQLPRPDLFYLPLSRTKSWRFLNQENGSLKKQLGVLLEKDINKDIEHLSQKVELLNNKLEAKVQETSLRRWTVNSSIPNVMRNYVYFVDLEETNIPLLEMILKGEFVALYGARASGKSTRVLQVMEHLKSKENIVCIYISFEGINMNTVDTFWSALGVELHINAPEYFKLNDVKSDIDFKLKFQKNQWNNKRAVLFIDEYDSLLGADDDIRYSFLGTIRTIRNAKDQYALWSSVAIGPFSILHLSSDRLATSPFNVREPFKNPNFSLKQVQTIFKEFENDFKLTIDPNIIKDIYNRTNGHASLVCLCGKVIHLYLMASLNEDRRLDFSIWLNFVINSMQSMIADYNTFRKMTITLEKEKFRPAIDFLRHVFLGLFNFISVNPGELKLAEFLTAEGVLLRDEKNKNRFKMSSIFIDELIRQRVIPNLYKAVPTCAVPKKPYDYPDIINILKIAIQFFDKEIISKAFNRSFKVAHVYVEGQKGNPVPRESVYDTELYRILVNWITKQAGFEVTGQWHLVEYTNEKNKHTYSDIVIKTLSQTVVLELLATATKKELDEHFVKVLDYAEKLSANEIWIVHFTCEDYTIPYWPSDKKFKKINVIHFFHDKMFNNIQMNARIVSASDTFNYINEVISLQ